MQQYRVLQSRLQRGGGVEGYVLIIALVAISGVTANNKELLEKVAEGQKMTRADHNKQ